MFGRLAVARDDRGLELASTAWSRLPFKAAIKIFESTKLVKRRAWGELKARYAEKAAEVAGDVTEYVLGQTRAMLEKAASLGASKSKILRGLATSIKGWGIVENAPHHVETVFETTIIASEQHGRYRQQRANVKTHPYWRYVTMGDDRVRPAHAAMNGKTYRTDDPVWETWYPPNGFRCRCKVTALRKSEVDQDDLETVAPKVQPDKGFDISPADWLKQRVV